MQVEIKSKYYSVQPAIKQTYPTHAVNNVIKK